MFLSIPIQFKYRDTVVTCPLTLPADDVREALPHPENPEWTLVITNVGPKDCTLKYGEFINLLKDSCRD